MKDNILIGVIFLACAFSLGVMAAGGLLPQSVLWIIAGGAVLIAAAVVFVGGILGVVWLMRPRPERPAPADPWQGYRPTGDHALHGRFERPTIDHQHVQRIEGHHQGHVDPWPTLGPVDDRRELPTPERRAISWRKN